VGIGVECGAQSDTIATDMVTVPMTIFALALALASFQPKEHYIILAALGTFP
jgi:hypothetical protein